MIRKRILPCLLIAVVSVVLRFTAGQSRFFQIVRLKTLDIHFVLRGTVPPHNIVLLTIDQKTLDTIPDLQAFWHPYYAEAIRAAAAGGAKVLAMDITFPVPVSKWDPKADEVLAEAVASTAPVMPVICGYIPSTMQNQETWPVPVNMIAAALGQAAYVNLTVGPDDFIREQEIVENRAATSNSMPARSLAMRTAEKFIGADAVSRGGALYLNGRQIPVDDDRALRINYSGPAGTFPRVRLIDFLTAAKNGRLDQIRGWVQGKAVLLGADNVMDRYPTPFFTLHESARWNTAGVEIHANTVRTLVDGDFLRDVSWPAQTAMIFTLAVIASFIGVFLPFGRAMGGLGVLIVAAMGGTHVAFRSGIVLPSFDFCFASLLCVLGSTVYRFFTAEKRGDLFHRAVTAFIGKSVAKSLDQSGKIAQTGTRQVVTILFSDIRGFTSFCDDKDPSVVVDLLNRYLSRMVDIIVSHSGQVNKFIGDGILAIFSDEDGRGLDDHAVRAARCGFDMVTTRVEQFRTGVGIHTGAVVIGNIGSSEKLEYTALGDTVNVASRLESLNKELKTQLLLSEETRSRLGDAVATRLAGTVQVRGKTEPMHLYTVAELAAVGQAVAAESKAH